MLPQEHPSAATLAAEDVESVLAEILGRPEYAPVGPPPLYRWGATALEWLRDRFGPLLRRLWPGPDWSDPVWGRIEAGLLGIGALLGLALLAYLLHMGARAVRRRRRAAARAEAADAPGPRTAADWEEAARTAAAREDWRGAAMALYQAVLLRLSAAGALQVDRSKTPGDYRGDVRRNDRELAARFDAFLRGFERVAYGPGSPGADHYARLSEAAGALGLHA